MPRVVTPHTRTRDRWRGAARAQLTACTANAPLAARRPSAATKRNRLLPRRILATTAHAAPTPPTDGGLGLSRATLHLVRGPPSTRPAPPSAFVSSLGRRRTSHPVRADLLEGDRVRVPRIDVRGHRDACIVYLPCYDVVGASVPVEGRTGTKIEVRKHESQWPSHSGASERALSLSFARRARPARVSHASFARGVRREVLTYEVPRRPRCPRGSRRRALRGLRSSHPEHRR